MSIRKRTWTSTTGTHSAIVVNWTDGDRKRRLRTFEHLRDAKEFHAIVHRLRPRRTSVLDDLADALMRNSGNSRDNRTITITRAQAEAILKIFPMIRKVR